MHNIIIFTCLLVDLVIGNASNGIKVCNTGFLNICPPFTKCVQNQPENQPETPDGECQCEDPRYMVNPKHTNDNDYCIDIKFNTSSSSSFNIISKNNVSLVTDHEASAQYEPKFKSSVRAHHIIAGVLIPIMFVLIAIGSIIAYKKLHITQRIRNIRRTHRNRPFYEDVMLGANDNDDPPLI